MVNAGETKEQKVNGDCDYYAMDVFYSAVDSGMSYADAFDLSEDAHAICEALNMIARFL